MFLYYTIDGSNPEGAGGEGIGTTEVVEMSFSHNEGSEDWWMDADIPKPANDTTLKYKIGIFKIRHRQCLSVRPRLGGPQDST